jgi:3-hydroxyacyl-CoA dehydrogenase/enoyl-CoA hydratase/3-hydroxybutyryl-CoA epimerase
MDLDGLPLPDDAPPEGACVRVEHPHPRLVRLVIDPPHRPKLAVFDIPVLRDLALALDQVEKEANLEGLVVTGREPLSFAGGADVESIARIDDPELAARFVRLGQSIFQRLHRLGRRGGGRVRVVAAVGGPVPGGACEIALACDLIVLADSPKTRIGLPEVRLGIFPAWGGTQRLPKRVGLPAALEAILTGKLYRAKAAKKRGIVDRLAKPEDLLRIADDIALGKLACRRHKRTLLQRFLVDRNPAAQSFIGSQARKNVMKQTKGQYPAPLAALPLVLSAPGKRLDRGLEDEVAAVRPLVVSPVTKSLVSLFLLSEEAKKLSTLPDGGKAARVTRGAVIGAGVMGGAIASLMAEKGAEARLRDLDANAIAAAVTTHRAEIEKKRKRRSLQRHEADGAIDRLETTTEAVGFGRCELVVEAVAERLDVKQAVFGELAALLPKDAILATNTSSLSVTAIADGLPNPERVVGMHFFNPVRKMPLVEIVRGERTSDAVVARTARLALDLGKTPVVVKDVAGFLVNRILGPYLDEATRLLEAGVDPDKIDAACVEFGMPMGPCELLDEVGIDIAAHAGASLEEAYGGRMQACRHLAPLVERGDLGKKTGAGIFRWTKDPKKKGRLVKAGRNPNAPAARGAMSISSEDVSERLVLAYVNEAARCLEEQVVAGAGWLDLAAVFGTGFAPFRGGPLRYVDARGIAQVVDRLRRLADAHDVVQRGVGRERFVPADNLARMAIDGTRFHD